MRPSDLGTYIDVVKGTPPAASEAGTVNGGWIGRRDINSCVLKASTGAETGSPSARTFDAKLQHADDGSGTGAADYQPAGPGSGAIAQITAVNSEAQKDIDLSGAKEFIRVVAVTGFTGGTTPKLANATELVLGGKTKL